MEIRPEHLSCTRGSSISCQASKPLYEIDGIERVEILRSLRKGEFDVLVGINLLREGLDLPEVFLVAILGSDSKGYVHGV